MRSNSLHFLSYTWECISYSYATIKKKLSIDLVEDKLFLQFEEFFFVLKMSTRQFTDPYHMISFINDMAIKLVILTISVID